ncbi:hypothetical protein J6590_049263, partial [Homalodisca vitripennis]
MRLAFVIDPKRGQREQGRRQRGRVGADIRADEDIVTEYLVPLHQCCVARSNRLMSREMVACRGWDEGNNSSIDNQTDREMKTKLMVTGLSCNLRSSDFGSVVHWIGGQSKERKNNCFENGSLDEGQPLNFRVFYVDPSVLRLTVRIKPPVHVLNAEQYTMSPPTIIGAMGIE